MLVIVFSLLPALFTLVNLNDDGVHSVGIWSCQAEQDGQHDQTVEEADGNDEEEDLEEWGEHVGSERKGGVECAGDMTYVGGTSTSIIKFSVSVDCIF